MPSKIAKHNLAETIETQRLKKLTLQAPRLHNALRKHTRKVLNRCEQAHKAAALDLSSLQR